MAIIQTIKDLVKIPSQTGNISAIKECLNYCKDCFKNTKVFIREEEHNQIPSILISNADTLDFDVIQIGHIDVVSADKSMFNPIEKTANFSDAELLI
jgi:acetylornithine deacetylase/succinyl-diaminopimelate desuccinylase-like protein